MIGTTLVFEHEIAKNEDFQHGFESILRNTAMLDKMLVSASRNYVVGGEVVAEATGSMNIYVRPLWANGRALEMPVYAETSSPLVFINPPVSANRIDTVEVRGVLQEYDSQRRAFFDPELENGRYYNVNTKVRLIAEIKVISGEEGNSTAPLVDEGYVKLAEIHLAAGENIITSDNIKNITALVDGESNTAWTNDLKASFYLGSINELKTTFGLEHNRDGTHRTGVIKRKYLKIGPENDALNAGAIPLGKKYVVNQDEWLATQNLYEGLESESIIRARDDALERNARITKDAELEERIRLLELQVIENTGRIDLLWDAVFADMTSNPFMFTFADLNGINLIQGNWDQGQQNLNCSATERVFNYTFANLDRITLEQGIWNNALRVLEC